MGLSLHQPYEIPWDAQNIIKKQTNKQKKEKISPSQKQEKTYGLYVHWMVDKQESAHFSCVFLGPGGCYLGLLGFSVS